MANMLETKILVNSIISDAHKGARFPSTDIQDHFLHTPMDGHEYLRVPFARFPEDIRKKKIFTRKFQTMEIYSYASKRPCMD